MYVVYSYYIPSQRYNKSMCGRYTLYTTDELEDRYRLEVSEAIHPNYNVAPSQTMPVITSEGLQMMRWGLIPPWAKDERIGYKLINARSETVFDKPMWKKPVMQRRCLVPANGFYEWKKTEAGKIPHYIYLTEDRIFSFAGIWETWKHEGNDWHTFSIMTTTPNEEMKPIHNRMPVIIDREDDDMWLKADTEEEIKALLQPLPDNSLKMHVVSQNVNIVKNNSQELIGPINSK